MIAPGIIEFGKGISKTFEVLDIGSDLGVITKRGAFYSYGETRLGQGRENAKGYLDEHPDLLQEIEQQVRARMFTGEVPEAAAEAAPGDEEN